MLIETVKLKVLNSRIFGENDLNMEVIFNELAVREMNDAIAYYELQFSGLGKAFKEEIRKAINRIIKYPKAW